MEEQFTGLQLVMFSHQYQISILPQTLKMLMDEQLYIAINQSQSRTTIRIQENYIEFTIVFRELYLQLTNRS